MMVEMIPLNVNLIEEILTNLDLFEEEAGYIFLQELMRRSYLIRQDGVSFLPFYAVNNFIDDFYSILEREEEIYINYSDVERAVYEVLLHND